MTSANSQLIGAFLPPLIYSDSIFEFRMNKLVPGCISAIGAVDRIVARRCLDHRYEASIAPGNSLLRAVGSYSSASRAARGHEWVDARRRGSAGLGGFCEEAFTANNAALLKAGLLRPHSVLR